jgi:hypothetical protein
MTSMDAGIVSHLLDSAAQREITCREYEEKINNLLDKYPELILHSNWKKFIPQNLLNCHAYLCENEYPKLILPKTNRKLSLKLNIYS